MKFTHVIKIKDCERGFALHPECQLQVVPITLTAMTSTYS